MGRLFGGFLFRYLLTFVENFIQLLLKKFDVAWILARLWHGNENNFHTFLISSFRHNSYRINYLSIRFSRTVCSNSKLLKNSTINSWRICGYLRNSKFKIEITFCKSMEIKRGDTFKLLNSRQKRISYKEFACQEYIITINKSRIRSTGC